MKFTDIFIRRPVLAMALSLLVLVLGLRSLYSLPVNEFPHTENAVVTVSTTYFGADAQTIAGFITQPLEAAIAQAQGIDYLSSTSTSGVSTITATLRLNYDSNRADRDQHPGQLGAQPAAAADPGAGADGADRSDRRCDVHRLLQ
jgi:multidrug efflux pump